ncbi:hypothetical protein T484DRAFT_1936506 [Baffinella frigidus]|nr:hypothetical protein T484DRAFT_1936506 [Cryptophyta sp. CCMP2293]
MTPSLSTRQPSFGHLTAAPQHAAYSRRHSALPSQSTGTGRVTPDSATMQSKNWRFRHHSSSAPSVLESGSDGGELDDRAEDCDPPLPSPPSRATATEAAQSPASQKQMRSFAATGLAWEETHPLLVLWCAILVATHVLSSWVPSSPLVALTGVACFSLVYARAAGKRLAEACGAHSDILTSGETLFLRTSNS